MDLPPNSKPDKTISPGHSLELRPLSASSNSAVAALETLRIAATFKASAKGVREVVGRRLALFPQTEMNDGEWAAWWADYVEALADVPLAALEAGMSAWVRKADSRFMPKPGELLHLAQTTPNPAQLAYDRERREQEHQTYMLTSAARMALEGPADAPPSEPVDPKDVKFLLKELDEKLTASPFKRPVPPPIQAKVDETGVSSELRRSIAWPAQSDVNRSGAA